MDGSYRFFSPKVPNPYPDGFERITDFCYETRLVLAREPKAIATNLDRRASYVVYEDYTVRYAVDGVLQRLTVPAGFITDLASVPRVARSIIGRVGPHLEAAIIHDYLFIAWQLVEGRGARKEDMRFANELMYAACAVTSMSAFQQWCLRTGLDLPVLAWRVYESPDEHLFVEL